MQFWLAISIFQLFVDILEYGDHICIGHCFHGLDVNVVNGVDICNKDVLYAADGAY